MGRAVYEIPVVTNNRTQMIDITHKVAQVVKQSGVTEGICCVYVPHTTAGITINENADPDVTTDMLMELNKRIPFNDGYLHAEGNSAAHIKATLTGLSQMVFIRNGQLGLGMWQGIYFCEFDGARDRTVWVKVIDA